MREYRRSAFKRRTALGSSPSLEDRLAATGDYDSAKQSFPARQAIGRFGRLEEIAELALYLASDAAVFTTSQAHVIDGV